VTKVQLEDQEGCRIILRYILGKYILSVGGGWNWLSIIFMVSFGVSDVEILDSATTVLIVCMCRPIYTLNICSCLCGCKVKMS
jgi:hypothetical protein